MTTGRSPVPKTKAREVPLGKVQTPSGNLVVVDFGLMGGWSKKVAASVKKTLEKRGRRGGANDALKDGNVIAIAGLPRSPLRVVGVRNGTGRWAKLWKHIDVKVSSAPVASTEEIGMVYVERARLMFADPNCLHEWVEDDTIDGLADLSFWGQDAAKLAKATGAKRIRRDVWGFTDIPLAEALEKYAELGRLCEKNSWWVRPDPREHDHHHFLLKATETSATQTGELVLGSARLFGFTLD